MKNVYYREYSPYGAPGLLLRGDGTKDPKFKEWIKKNIAAFWSFKFPYTWECYTPWSLKETLHKMYEFINQNNLDLQLIEKETRKVYTENMIQLKNILKEFDEHNLKVIERDFQGYAKKWKDPVSGATIELEKSKIKSHLGIGKGMRYIVKGLKNTEYGALNLPSAVDWINKNK